MRPGDDRGWPTRWALLAGLLLLSGATAVAFDDADRAPGRLLVGELLLSDDDETRRDSVSGTFQAINLAPGDTVGGELAVIREPGVGPTRSALEPRVALSLELDAGDALPAALRVTSLAYGEASLLDRVRDGCGAPLTLDRLVRCTQAPRHPLSNLPDPGPDGRAFELGIQLPPSASNAVQGEDARFTVTVELKGTLPGSAIDPLDPPASPPGALDCYPLDPPDRTSGALGTAPGRADPHSIWRPRPSSIDAWPAGPGPGVLFTTDLGPCVSSDGTG